MSAWDLGGIGVRPVRGLWVPGGGISTGPWPSPLRRERGAAIERSMRSRSMSPVTAKISPSGPTWASWNATRSLRAIRRTRPGSAFGSRPYGWALGKTASARARIARCRVSSASMRRSLRISPRTRSTSFAGNAGRPRHSTRSRTVSAAVSRVHRPWHVRTSSDARPGRRGPPGRAGPRGPPLRRDAHAPPPVVDEVARRGPPDLLGLHLLHAGEHAVGRVPGGECLHHGHHHPLIGDAVVLVPEPGADLALRAVEPRLRGRGLPEAFDLAIDDGLDGVEARLRSEGRVRDQERGVDFQLLADRRVRRELRLHEGAVQPVRPGAPFAGRERREPAPP